MDPFKGCDLALLMGVPDWCCLFKSNSYLYIYKKLFEEACLYNFLNSLPTDFVADLVIDSMCLDQLSFSVSHTPRYLNSAPLTNKVSSILKAEEGCYGQDLLEMINYLHLEALKFIAF